MPYRNVEQGIAAIQAGRLDEGGRMLKIALKDPDLTGTMRAIANLWLAETTPDPQTKRTYYDEALAADPNNPQIRQRVETWLAAQLLPPTPVAPAPQLTPPPQPAVPAQPGWTNQPVYNVVPQQPTPSLPKTGPLSVVPQPGSIYHLAGMFGGPNGPGTGFFISRDGLLATTRYVVGGLENVTVELETGRQIPGRVVRAYPEIDLAFVYVEMSVNELLPITPLPRIPDDAVLNAISYNGRVAKGKRRSTKRLLSPQWFPTNIKQTELPDAGGCPVMDDRHYLVGMLTRSTSSTSNFVYGIHINTIRKFLESFRQETLDGNRLYCAHCGHFSKATAAGGYYCEACGALSSQAEHISRVYRPQTAIFYQEHSRISCMYCNATVGFHNNACLRCGRSPGQA